jgi:hypothetical protein
MAAVAPHIEAWARRSPVLRRCRLATEDDARAILVATMVRLKQREFENLRTFISRQADELAPLPSADEADVAADDSTDNTRTPLRAWLLGLVRFLIKDHVEQRLGWHGDRRAEDDDPSGRQASKRDLGTDAARFDELFELGSRPPITNMLAGQELLDRVVAHLATFPPTMRDALEAWLRGETFQEIALSLSLRDADAARALIRAGQARLRDRLREKR